MQPQRLYESLPYLYLGFSLLFLALSSGQLSIIAPALLLYIAGSIIWILRSNARRADRRKNNIHQAHLKRELSWHNLPLWLYEELPFIYLALGLLCLYSLDHILATISGLLLILCSLTAFTFRVSNRKYPG